jgi:hypothetical protein
MSASDAKDRMHAQRRITGSDVHDL